MHSHRKSALQSIYSKVRTYFPMYYCLTRNTKRGEQRELLHPMPKTGFLQDQEWEDEGGESDTPEEKKCWSLVVKETMHGKTWVSHFSNDASHLRMEIYWRDGEQVPLLQIKSNGLFRLLCCPSNYSAINHYFLFLSSQF